MKTFCAHFCSSKNISLEPGHKLVNTVRKSYALLLEWRKGQWYRISIFLFLRHFIKRNSWQNERLYSDKCCTNITKCDKRRLSQYKRLKGWEGWGNKNKTDWTVRIGIECFKSSGKNKASIIINNIDASSTLLFIFTLFTW